MRERTYQQLDLDYVCGTTLVAEALLDKIRPVTGTTSTPSAMSRSWSSGRDEAEGKQVARHGVEAPGLPRSSPAGKLTFIPHVDTVLQPGDIIFGAVKDEAVPKLERFMEE